MLTQDVGMHMVIDFNRPIWLPFISISVRDTSTQLTLAFITCIVVFCELCFALVCFTDIELREFGRTRRGVDEERFSEIGEPEESITDLETQRKKSTYRSRPLPPLPPPRDRSLKLGSGNLCVSDSEEPYYVEVLEHVDRPINVEATVQEPPREPSTPKPMFRTHQEFDKLPSQLRPSSNLAVSDIVSNGNSRMDAAYGDSFNEESPYCDNPSYFPNVETANLPIDVPARNETADSEDPYIEVLEHVDHPFKNQAATFCKAQHEQLTSSANQSTEKASDELTADVITVKDTRARRNLRANTGYSGHSGKKSSQISSPCYFSNDDTAERVHDVYVCDPMTNVETEKQPDENKAQVEDDKTSIFVTVTSNMMEVKVYRNQTNHLLTKRNTP